MRLKGKTAIVTGGARGIGAAIVRRFAQEGARVVLADVLEEEGGALANHLQQEYDVTFIGLDVADEEHWARVVRAAEQLYGRLDILVNNAGIAGGEGRVDDTSLQEWERIMRVNSTGTFLGVRAAVRAMRVGGGGSIINISSIYGIVGTTGLAAYHASKGAVRLLTKSAAVTYGGDGIRVNSVHPGYIETPMTAPIDEASRKALIEATPIGRAGQPLEVANACVFLASDESSFITGAELVVDGGYTAQ